jgi:hypothetical protein
MPCEAAAGNSRDVFGARTRNAVCQLERHPVVPIDCHPRVEMLFPELGREQPIQQFAGRPKVEADQLHAGDDK